MPFHLKLFFTDMQCFKYYSDTVIVFVGWNDCLQVCVYSYCNNSSFNNNNN